MQLETRYEVEDRMERAELRRTLNTQVRGQLPVLIALRSGRVAAAGTNP